MMRIFENFYGRFLLALMPLALTYGNITLQKVTDKSTWPLFALAPFGLFFAVLYIIREEYPKFLVARHAPKRFGNLIFIGYLFPLMVYLRPKDFELLAVSRQIFASLFIGYLGYVYFWVRAEWRERYKQTL